MKQKSRNTEIKLREESPQTLPLFRSQGSGLSLRSGQAIVEFCVGLVCIMALMVALLQIGSISKIRTDMMAQARKEAGESSMEEFTSLSGAEVIDDWEEGADGVRYSADDSQNNGDATDFQASVVDYAVDDSSEWPMLETMENNDIAELNSSADPINNFGLVSAVSSASVTNNDAFRGLINAAETIDFEVKVWMTSTTGIY